MEGVSRIARGEVRVFTDGRNRRRHLVAAEDIDRLFEPVPVERTFGVSGNPAA